METYAVVDGLKLAVHERVCKAKLFLALKETTDDAGNTSVYWERDAESPGEVTNALFTVSKGNEITLVLKAGTALTLVAGESIAILGGDSGRPTTTAIYRDMPKRHPERLTILPFRAIGSIKPRCLVGE